MSLVVLVLLAGIAVAALLALAYRGVAAGVNSETAFGAVCLALATMLGCLLLLVLYAGAG